MLDELELGPPPPPPLRLVLRERAEPEAGGDLRGDPPPLCPPTLVSVLVLRPPGERIEVLKDRPLLPSWLVRERGEDEDDDFM